MPKSSSGPETAGPPRVVCIGAAHFDILGLAGQTVGQGADVPGRVVTRPGGVALNVALGLARLDRPVALVAPVGTDAMGAALHSRIVDAGIAADGLLTTVDTTDAYVGVEDPSGGLVAAVADCSGIERAADGLVDRALSLIRTKDRVFVEANLPTEALRTILSALPPERLAVNPASPAKAQRLRAVGLRGTIYCNLAEAAVLVETDLADAEAAALALVAAGASGALVSAGTAPVVWADGRGPVLRAVPAGGVGPVTGAGDALIAGHIAALMQGLDRNGALGAAVAAAGAWMAQAGE